MMSTNATATNSNPLSALADLAAMSETERAASRTSTSSSVSRANSPGETDCCRAAAAEKDASAAHSDDLGNATCSKDDNSRKARTVDAKEEDVKMEEEVDLEQELVNQEHPSSSPSFADRGHPHDCHEVSQESLFSSSSSLLASCINSMNIHSNDNNGNCGSNNHDDDRRSIASEEQKLFRQRKNEMNRRPAKKRAVPSDLDMGFGMTVHPNIAAAAAAATSGKSGGSSSSPSLNGRGAGAGRTPSSKSNGSKGQAGNSNKAVKANVKSSPRSPSNVKGALNANGCHNGNPKKKKSESLFNSNNGHDNPPKKIRSKKTSHSNNHNSTEPPPSFPVILMAILSSPHTEGNQTNVSDVISFLSDNQSFIVVNPMVLEQEILPKHFGDYRHGHSNGNNNNDNIHGNRKIETFHEFQETLLYWGFTCESDPKYPKVNVWRHPMFRKGDWEECMKITRPEHPRLRSDQGEDGADDDANEAGAGSGDGRDGGGPKKFPPNASSFGGTTFKRPLYREYYSRDDDEEFVRQQFLRGHIHHQRGQQQQHPLAHVQQEHLLQQRHQQQLQPRRDRPESPPREENEANERHRNQQMMDHNARSVTPSGESIDGERHPGNATGANHHIQLPRSATNAAVSSEAPHADFDSPSSQLESVKQAVLRRAMAMEASPAFSRRHSDLMVSATQNMNLMYPSLPRSNHGGMGTGGAGGSAAVDHSRLRLERDYQSMTDVELQEYRRQLLLEREHCLRASLGLGYNGLPSESTMMNKMGVIRRGPIFTGGSGRGMDTEASYREMMGYGGNSGDHSMEAATAVAAMPRRYSALGVQSVNDPDGMLSSSSRLTSHPYNGASESLLQSSRWNPRERSSSMPLGMQFYHGHDGMMPQQRAPSDEDVKMATEDVVSAALDALRRGEASQQQQEQQQQMFQQGLNHQRPRHRGPHPRSFKRSRRHTVDHVPSIIAGANSVFPDAASASAASGVPPAMNLTSTTSSLDAMTEQFLERSRARLSGRPMGISVPSNSLFASSSSASRFGMDHSSTGCSAADFNQHSGNSAVSGGAYFSSHRKNNVGAGMQAIGNAGAGGMTGSISNGNNAMNAVVSSERSLMASVGAEVDAQARAILAQRRASMGL
mmetsp:Transcript_12822/g.27188  ORF Transcript_12822/g.27188 Transcript_12822/m.27188 type:complete len:1118 (-) Transcript_12822:127-3480(-)